MRPRRDLAVARGCDAGQRVGAADGDGVVGDADGGGAVAVPAPVVGSSAGAARGKHQDGGGDDAGRGDQPPGPCDHSGSPFEEVETATARGGAAFDDGEGVRRAEARAPQLDDRADQSGRGEQDDQDHHQAVDERGQLGGLDRAEPGALAPAGDHAGEEGQQRCADQCSGQAAEPAEDNRGEQGEAEGEREAAGGREAHRDREHRPGRAGTRRAHREGGDPRPAEVDARELGGHLVVADGLPAAPDPAAGQVRQQHEGDDQQDPGDVGDVLAAGQVGAGDEVRRVEGPCRDVGEPHQEALLAAQPVVEEECDAGHCDGQREGGAGQVGTVQPGRGRPDQHTDQERDERGDDEDAGERQHRGVVLEESAVV